jgi:hypothetical protein
MTFLETYLQHHNLGVRSQEEELEGDKNSPNYPKFIRVYLRLSAFGNPENLFFWENKISRSNSL